MLYYGITGGIDPLPNNPTNMIKKETTFTLSLTDRELEDLDECLRQYLQAEVSMVGNTTSDNLAPVARKVIGQISDQPIPTDKDMGAIS